MQGGDELVLADVLVSTGLVASVPPSICRERPSGNHPPACVCALSAQLMLHDPSGL